MDKGQIDEIRRRVSLYSLISARVTLQRRGQRYVGLCPFHNEKTPSFHVVENQNFYYCFGCTARGDVFDWVQKTQGVSFREALAQLAKQAGIVLRHKPENIEMQQKREAGERICNIIAVAEKFYRDALLSTIGTPARAYLKKRGISDECAQKFALGWADKDTSLFLKYMKNKGCSEKELCEAGLAIFNKEAVSEKSNNQLRARFRSRITFPIADNKGRTIAFGGRLLKQYTTIAENTGGSRTQFVPPKYLNSPETSLFVKGNMLYNFTRARAEVRQKKQQPVLVEGYMDVIALDRVGFSSALASLGTAVSEKQLELLWSLGDEPVLCFDGDSAGEQAASRVVIKALPLLNESRSLRLFFLPKGEDPDSFIQKFGVTHWRKRLEKTETVSEFLWRLELGKLRLAGHVALQNPEQFATLDKALQQHTKSLNANTLQKHYRDFFKDALFAERRKMQSAIQNKIYTSSKTLKKQVEKANIMHFSNDEASRLRNLQEKLVVALAKNPELWDEYEERFTMLTLPDDLDATRQALLLAYTEEAGASNIAHTLWQSGGEVLNHIAQKSNSLTHNPYSVKLPIKKIVDNIFAALDYIETVNDLGKTSPEAREQNIHWRDDARRIFTQQ